LAAGLAIRHLDNVGRGDVQKNLPLALVTARWPGVYLASYATTSIHHGLPGRFRKLLIDFCSLLWRDLDGEDQLPSCLVAPMIALFVPLLDVCLSVLRRFLRRQPISRPTRGHIHHRLSIVV